MAANQRNQEKYSRSAAGLKRCPGVNSMWESHLPKARKMTKDIERETGMNYYTKVDRHNNCLVMLKIKGDGSCLFSSILHQLEELDIRSEAHRIAVQNMRKEIVDFIESNWRSYEELILAEATSMNAEWPNDNQKEAVIKKHIRKLRKPNTWGGSEIIAAASDKLHIIIRVFTCLYEPMVFDGSQGRGCREAIIFFNGLDHYDSVIEIRSARGETGSEFDKLMGWRFRSTNVSEEDKRQAVERADTEWLRETDGICTLPREVTEEIKDCREEKTTADDECECGVDCRGNGGLVLVGVDDCLAESIARHTSEQISGCAEESEEVFVERGATGDKTKPMRERDCCNETEQVLSVDRLAVMDWEAERIEPEVSQREWSHPNGLMMTSNSNEGDSLFVELVVAHWSLQRMSWKAEVNALNLRRATTKEIQCHFEYYAGLIKPGWKLDEFSDLLTHWNVIGNGVDKEICWAVTEVLGVNIEVVVDGAHFQFYCRSYSTTRIVRIFEEDGVYRKGSVVMAGSSKQAGVERCTMESRSVEAVEIADMRPECEVEHMTELPVEKAYCATDLEPVQEDGENSQTKTADYHMEIATINCRGCASDSKREDIDHQMNKLKIEVCAIQETRIIWTELETKNYKWYCSPCESQTSHRGVGILVQKSSGVQIKGFRAISENICSAWVEKTNFGMILIVVHVPSDKRMPNVYAQIASLLSKIPPEDDYTIIGDFNGRIGRLDVTEDFSGLVGGQLEHEESNENGTFLLQLVMQFKLVVSNTFARSKSVLKTWSNNTVSSQIDHILIPLGSRIRVRRNSLKAVEAVFFNSDHRIIRVCIRKSMYMNTVQQRRAVTDSRRGWNVKLLSDQNTKQKFAEAVKTGLVQMEGQQKVDMNLESKWNNLKKVLKDAANTTIPAAKRAPLSPRTKKAYTELQRKRFRQNRFADVERCRLEVKLAREEFERAKREHVWKTWREFFDKIHEMEPFVRIKLTYEFLKDHKHQKERKYANVQISQFKWLEALYASTTDGVQFTKLVEGGDKIAAPTVGEIQEILHGFRNGTAPGSDGIQVELFKNAPNEFVEELQQLLREVWDRNEVPEEFQDTVQVPIPKKSAPKSVEEFRRITLCNVAYKILTQFILRKLDAVTEELPTYQAAFLANRRVEDHVFTARRVTEEFWNHGKKLFVLAIDIKQAFDSVSQEAIVEALQYLGVPNYLINRVMCLGLKERTCIRWRGNKTPKVEKGKGVKQGCPLSPRLFTYVIHLILCRLKQEFPNLELEHRVQLVTPLILAYADDILVIAESIEELDSLVEALKRLLEQAGLVIHPGKSELLVRDPFETKVVIEDSFDIGGMCVESKGSARYLGAYLSATVNRPVSIKQRCLQGVKVSKMLLPFIAKNKPPWEIVRRIYSTVVVPTVIFALNASSITAQNRRSLRRFERKVVREWRDAVQGPRGTVRKLLNGRTITLRIKISRFGYWAHMVRRPENHLLQSALNLRIEGPKRKCRPCDTWHKTLDKDLASVGKTREDYLPLLLQREAFRKELEKLYEIREASDSEVSTDASEPESGSED